MIPFVILQELQLLEYRKELDISVENYRKKVMISYFDKLLQISKLKS